MSCYVHRTQKKLLLSLGQVWLGFYSFSTSYCNLSLRHLQRTFLKLLEFWVVHGHPMRHPLWLRACCLFCVRRLPLRFVFFLLISSALVNQLWEKNWSKVGTNQRLMLVGDQDKSGDSISTTLTMLPFLLVTQTFPDD